MQMHFFAFFCISRRRSFFCLFCIFFFASAFPFIVAIHGQICVTCAILRGGGQMHLFAFFWSLNLHPPPALCILHRL